MKKLFVFFCFHFFIIITLQTYLFINSAFEKDVPVLGYLKNKVYAHSLMKHYLVFSGINTGYGFYGINVATNKFFFVEVLDSENRIIKKIDVSDFNTKNSYSRFSTCPSWFYNFNIETNEIKTKSKGKNDNNESKKYYKLRDRYLEKVYEYIGRSNIKNIKNCESFNVKLVTVVPPDIWNSNLEQNNIYVLQKFNFKNR